MRARSPRLPQHRGLPSNPILLEQWYEASPHVSWRFSAPFAPCELFRTRSAQVPTSSSVCAALLWRRWWQWRYVDHYLYGWIGRRCQFTRRPPRAATWSDDGVVWLYWHVSLTGGARSLTDWAGEVVGVHTGGKRLRCVQGCAAEQRADKFGKPNSFLTWGLDVLSVLRHFDIST